MRCAERYIYDPAGVPFDGDKREVPVDNTVSGYMRYVDTGRLLYLAKTFKLRVRTLRRVGHFVPAGVALFRVSPAERLDFERASELRAAFDIGPTRTMQQDVEFGVIQIVDIALKAISPAVNDPSTAITCVDQLGRILIRFVSRKAPVSLLCDPPHVVRVIVPWIGIESLLDTAFEQIRPTPRRTKRSACGSCAPSTTLRPRAAIQASSSRSLCAAGGS